MGQRLKESADSGEAEDSRDTNVYRVSGEGCGRWHVYQEPQSTPIASFTDKAAALNYAMCLARGRVAWHLLLRQRSPADGPRSAGKTHH